MLERDDIVAISARFRYAMRQNGSSHNPIGLYQGLVTREATMSELRRQEDLWDYGENTKKDDILFINHITSALPNPFWSGIHPTIAEILYQKASEKDSSFWDNSIGEEVKPANTRILPVEHLNDLTSLREQVEFINSYLPKGNINTVFLTKGRNTVWKKIPLASSFAGNPHQMSIPMGTPDNIKGFNALLLTETQSKIVPEQWVSDKRFTTMEWMNLHQVGHSKIIPTCWEYLDRTYSLLTPTELLGLTIERNRSITRWFRHYGFDINSDDIESGEKENYIPDSTSFLYEVKVIERANLITKNEKISPTDKIPTDLYWFRGFHLDEITSVMNLDRNQILGAIAAMDKYWLANYDKKPKDPIFNSAVHSTDFGTQPSEEVCVDMVAMRAAGVLPERYAYWNGWLNKIDSLWNRWENNS